jgi:oligopeptide/dipeptide ABC transporter ATP-binding protein
MNDILLSLEKIRKYYPVKGGILNKEKGRVNVLNTISLEIRKNEILGLVGESGCGKTTLAKLVMRSEQPSSGVMKIFNKSTGRLQGREKRNFYQQVQMVFQDPYSSLNPKMKVKNIIGEMLSIQKVPDLEIISRVKAMLNDVGLKEGDLEKYPHQFSGGQRQRIAIARALIVRPKLLIADEPVSALDLVIAAQIIDLLISLKEKYKFSILFISHDLNMVSRFCDRVAVMYLGRIVESLPGSDLFSRSCHPYLKGLLAAVPVADPRLRTREIHLTGEVPSPMDLPSGCFFHPRCKEMSVQCKTSEPELSRLSSEHFVSCHHKSVSGEHGDH